MTSLTFHDDPVEFLEVARDHLAADPVVSTVVATTAERAAREDAAGVPVEVPHRWWVVARDDSGHVIGSGMRTAPFSPYPLFVLPMPDDAAAALAAALHERGEVVGGVNGALPAAEVCAAEVARVQGCEVDVQMRTRLHRLDVVVPPRPVPGRLRAARHDEVGLAFDWYAAFVRDADEQAGREPGSHHEMGETEAGMARRIEGKQVWFWVDADDRPVHVTGVNPPAFGAARLGPVYTPREYRGRGYAANTVAVLSQRILEAGDLPCLFTDRANPTSNQLYAALGYRPAFDMVNLLVG